MVFFNLKDNDKSGILPSLFPSAFDFVCLLEERIFCVCGGGSRREVISRVRNAVESNLQQISHGPFGVQELLRKQERKRERRERESAITLMFSHWTKITIRKLLNIQ